MGETLENTMATMNASDFAANLIDAGVTASAVKAAMKKNGYSKEEIASVEFPASAKSNEIDAYAIMRAIIEMEDQGVSRKEMAKKLAADDHCTESTGRHIVSLMKFVKAYHEIQMDG